jgi:hypothetical protein
MNMDFIKNKAYIDYILVFALWLLIFGKNVFSSMMFVDYLPSIHQDLGKFLVLSNYTFSLNLFNIGSFVFYYLGILSFLAQLFLLFSMLFSFIFIKKLCRSFGNDGRSFGNNERIYSLLFALVYFFNPFVYARIMIGHFAILYAYLLIPVFVFYLFRIFEKEFNFKLLFKLVLSLTLICSFAPHFIVILFLIFLVAGFWNLYYKNIKLSKFLKLFSLFLLFSILINFFWIQGIFSNSIFSVIDSNHEDFFAPKASLEVPAVAKTIGMWGFWRESGILTTYKFFPSYVWYFLMSLFVLLMILGYLHDKDKIKAKVFFSLFWLGVLLGTGISHPYTGKIFDFLFNNLPFFNGFRDSNKFVSLVVLSFAYLCPKGLFYLISKLKFDKNKVNNETGHNTNGLLLKIVLILAFVALIITYTFPLISLHNQLKPLTYPTSYTNANDFLKENSPEGYTIYLPWQLYLTYNWSQGNGGDGRIANVINHAVETKVITGTDKYGSSTKLMSSIESCLKSENISCLEDLGVQYLIKDSCALFPDNYLFVENATKVYANGCIKIYEINNKQSAVYSNVPLRFILGISLSILTFILLLVLSSKQKGNKI